MTANSWNWKGKDGSRGGLLYESGNWGDFLKLLWLVALIGWKNRKSAAVNYFDPFAGDIKYPLSEKTRFRIEQANLADLALIRPGFLDQGFWPSSAAAAAGLARGSLAIFDADPDRRRNWLGFHGVRVLEGESGWTLLAAREPDPAGVWLLDPYDFLAEWRAWLPTVVEKAESTTILLYIYNRSARSAEAFADYRNFRNALEDARGGIPKRLGRVAADAFLPRAHHEMLLLPSLADAAGPDFSRLSAELAESTALLNAARNRAEFFDA